MRTITALFMLCAAGQARAQLPCQLTPKDLSSLAVSDSKIDSQEKAEALSPEEQRLLCLTRELVRNVNKHKTNLRAVTDYSTDYTTDMELENIGKVESSIIARKLGSKPG